MNTFTISEFARSKNFKQINPAVSVNTNGYPFVTFINPDVIPNVAENIYFSKASSVNITKGTPVTKELLSKLRIGETINADGELRLKLIGLGERLELSDLLG